MRMPTLAIAIAALLAGCASAPPRDSRPLLAERLSAAGVALPDASSFEPHRDAARSIEQAPLDVEAALRFAFTHNPRVAAELARLDGARADSLQAGLLANPMLSLMLLQPSGGGRLQIESGLMQSLADWLQRPLRQTRSDATQRRVEAEVLGELLALAQKVQTAHIDAATSDQRLRVLDHWLDLDRQALALSQRQVAAGLVPVDAVLQQQRELRELEAEHSAVAAGRRAALATLAAALGLEGANGLQLTTEFPAFALPGLELWPLPRAEVLAAEAAVDEAEALQRLAASGSARWQPALAARVMRGSDGMRQSGIELVLAPPLFDRGQARIAAADAQHDEAVHRAEASRRQATLEVETALDRLRHLHESAERSGEALQHAERLHQLGEQRWRQGVTAWSAYRELGVSTLRAELMLVAAERERRVAAIELAHALGRAVLP